jgi:hypothetical protein
MPYAIELPVAPAIEQWELQSLSTVVSDMIGDALTNHLTRVKGKLGDPFIYAIGGLHNQREIGGLAYDNASYGAIAGGDRLISMDNERYLRLGVALAYIRGRTTFSGTNAADGQRAEHNTCCAALYGAYEFFCEGYDFLSEEAEILKTDINVSLGIAYGQNNLRRNSAGGSYSAKVNTANVFVRAEFVGNIMASVGFHCGPWLVAKYSHIHQGSYGESEPLEGRYHTAASNSDTIGGIIGINVEKEIASDAYADRSTKITIRGGWNRQLRRKTSSAVVTTGDIAMGENGSGGNFPTPNSAIFTVNFASKLNANWIISGSWIGQFSRDVKGNDFSFAVEYAF